jgi:hypothetical protein
MTLIVLVAIGCLACVFYLYVLYHWIRDTDRKRIPHSVSAEESDRRQESKRLYIMDSQKIADKRDRSDVSTYRTPSTTVLAGRRGWHESERIAYHKIVTSLSLRKRS